MALGGVVDFELWSRQSWPNVDVVGESYRSDEIRALFPRLIGPNDREVVGIAQLLPEPTNRFDPTAVNVVVAGRHVGYLAKEVAATYFPILMRLVQRGFTPVTPCRIFGYETRDWEGTDGRGRDIWRDRFEAQARIVLDEPHLVVPANLPPTNPHRPLPTGSALQLKGEETHLDVLAPLVSGAGEAFIYGSLHQLTVTSGRTQRDVVEVRVDGSPIGTLTPAMSANFAPVIAHLSEIGEDVTARVFLKGNALKVEAVLYAAKAHELDASWLRSESPSGSPDQTKTGRAQSKESATQPNDSIIVRIEPSPGQQHLTVDQTAPTVAIPPKPSRIVFNPPPGWPPAPEGFEPAPGWQPLAEWPAPPPDWNFWVGR